MDFVRDSFLQKGLRILRSTCDDNGVTRSLQCPAAIDGSNDEEIYEFLEHRLYAATLLAEECQRYLMLLE